MRAMRLSATGIVAAIAFAMVLFAVHTSSVAERSARREALTSLVAQPTSADSDRRATGWQGQLVKAASATAWPALSPPVSALTYAGAKELAGCLYVSPYTLTGCSFGDEAAPRNRRAVVLGDAVAAAWLPGVRGALGSSWHVQGLTWAGCPAFQLTVDDPERPGHPVSGCADHQSWALRETLRERPAVVILTTGQDTLSRMPCCSTQTQALVTWRKHEGTAVSTLVEAGVTVIVLAPPPLVRSLRQCAPSNHTPAECAARIDDSWRALSTTQAAMAKSAGATYVDTESWFCIDGICPAFVGRTPVTTDGRQLTDAFSSLIAPLLREVLT